MILLGNILLIGQSLLSSNLTMTSLRQHEFDGRGHSTSSIESLMINKWSGWWFGTCFFPYIWNNNPNWLIFFRGVGQPPTSFEFKFYRTLSTKTWQGNVVSQPIIAGYRSWSVAPNEHERDHILLGHVGCDPIKLYIYIFIYNSVYIYVFIVEQPLSLQDYT
jgi:hypothetical protein